jgi:hypothetical protein
MQQTLSIEELEHIENVKFIERYDAMMQDIIEDLEIDDRDLVESI